MTASERRGRNTDGDVVRTAAIRAGRHALLFDTAAMLEEAESLGGLQAASASSVARLLRDLKRGAVAPLMRVPSRVQLIRYPLPRPDWLVRHRGAFLLTERLADLRTADPQILDDRARALLAL